MKMKTMKIWRLALAMLAVFSLASCSSDNPQWADPEAHEKTEQLRAQYTPLIVGTWHYEKTSDKKRAFEQLTFNADGTLSGLRRWQSRQLVTIDGQELYTNWQDIADENGTFTGKWSLSWERNSNGMGRNRIFLDAHWDDMDNPIIAYCHNASFGYADATTLQFAGYWQNSDGWTVYERGEAKPSF